MVSGKIKAAIHFVIRGIVDEDTLCGMASKLMWGCCGQVRVACTPKGLKMLIVRRCVV
jgi:hypothetical protein